MYHILLEELPLTIFHEEPVWEAVSHSVPAFIITWGREREYGKSLNIITWYSLAKANLMTFSHFKGGRNVQSYHVAGEGTRRVWWTALMITTEREC